MANQLITSTKTRVMYADASLGEAIPSEAVAGIIAFDIVDLRNLPAQWFSAFWYFCTTYYSLNNPVLGYLTLTEVVDEDEVKTGHPRTRMYFGMSGFIITLGRLLVAASFKLMMPGFGYDTLLDIQPSHVNLGFRLFLTMPTMIVFVSAIFLLWLYPLNGKRLLEIQAGVAANKTLAGESPL
jgi:Na+/melibiose symporter-like transporter